MAAEINTNGRLAIPALAGLLVDVCDVLHKLFCALLLSDCMGTITAWYQFLHATQPAMSICNFGLILLSDVLTNWYNFCIFFIYLSRLIILYLLLANKDAHYWTLKFKMAEIRHLENRHDVIFFCQGDLIWIKFHRLVQNDMSTVVIVEIETRCRILIWRPFGRFNGMSFQSHVSHCRVLPLDKYTVIIPKPHATLQGVRIPSAILKIVFRHILFNFF